MIEILHIQLLGEFCLQRDGEVITTVQSLREQSLLAYLLLHRDTPQSRQHVSFLFWPEATEAGARNQLRKVLFRLRQDLPDADTFLHADTQTIQWQIDAPFELDVAEFEHGLALAEQLHASGHRKEALPILEEALGLYQGDLLPSCYDDWIWPERERLSQRFVRASEVLLALLEAQREYAHAIEVAQRLLRHDPLHEPGYRNLMRLYALTGNRASALRVYHTCTTNLEEELGVEPDLDTRQVYERLLRTDVHVKPVVSPLPDLATSPPLVGRHRDWTQLLSIWQRASMEAPRLALLEGVAGIGKTRLAEELGRWVRRQRHRVLTARCYAAEGELAYGPVIQWLRARPLPALKPVWRRELARLLPELLDDLPDGESLSPMTEAWQRQRLFEALARAMLARQSPLLLILDDVQWCDQETLAWLHYLMRFDHSAHVLIVATLRLEEFDVNHPLSAWVRSVERSVSVHKLVLGPLSADETIALAVKVAGQNLDDEMAACIFEETEGNPLFVVEMVRAGKVGNAQDLVCPPQGLPAKVQATIEDRLALLSPAAQALIDIAAVVGRDFTFEILMQAGGLDHDAALRALDELWQRRIVREQDETGYDFTHDKLRQVAYASLTEARRRYLHRKVAAALEVFLSTNPDVMSKQVATHYEQSGDAQRALPYLLQAADYAWQIYANKDAADLYERVFALTETHFVDKKAEQRLRALSGLGQVYLRLGQPPKAEDQFRAAIALGQEIGMSPRQLARLYRWLGVTLHQQSRYEAEIQAGEEGLAMLDENCESVEVALLLDTIAVGYYFLGNRTRARAFFRRIAAFVEKLPYSDALSSIYDHIGWMYLWDKNVDETTHWLHILETKADNKDEHSQGFIHKRLEDISAGIGDLRNAIAHLHQALACAVRTGDTSSQSLHYWRLGLHSLALGDVQKAEEYARAAREINVTMEGREEYLAWSLLLLGLILCCRGLGDEAKETLAQAAACAQRVGNSAIDLVSNLLLERIYLMRGDQAAAHQHIQRVLALSTPETFGNWSTRTIRPSALAFASVLRMMEEVYDDPQAFREFCRQFPERESFVDGIRHAPALDQFALVQWALEPATLAKTGRLLLNVSFDAPLTSPWTWHDPLDDCAYQVDDGLEIHAANGRDLWHINRSAPHVLYPLSDVGALDEAGFAFEAVCGPAAEDRPTMGGLLLWLDETNYLRLDRGTGGPQEITFLGCVDNRDIVIGRGWLKTDVDGPPATSDHIVVLRLEWLQGQVRALCHLEEDTWFTVGYIDFPFEARAQVGVYAIGNIDRLIYHGAYPEGAAVRFTAMRCWALAEEST